MSSKAKISYEDFVLETQKQFNQRETFSLTNFHFTENISLDEGELASYSYIEFKGCNFESFEIINHKFKSVNFINCNFKRVKLINLEIDTLLRFIGRCIINDFLSVENCNVENFKLYEFQIPQGILSLKNSICAFLDIRRGRIGSELTFNKCEMKGRVRCENLTSDKGNIIFKDSSFDKKVFFILGSFHRGIIFDDSVFHESITFDSVELNKSLSIIGTSFKKSLKFNFSSPITNGEGESLTKNAQLPEKVYIQNSEFGDELIFNGNYENDPKPNGKSEKLTIKASNLLKGKILISHTHFEEIVLSGLNQNANIILDSITSNKIDVSNFTNLSNLQLQKLKASDEESEVNISYSDLSKTKMYNIDFSSFKRVTITDSQLTDISTANINWPKRLYTKKNEGEDQKHYFKALREVYRQLKFTLKKHGENIQALEFGKLEMEAYRNELKSSKRYAEQFILWSNQSNDYGQNWVKPLLLLLYINYIFFMYIVFSGEFTFDFTLNTYTDMNRFWKMLWEVKGKYFYLLNPAHNIRHLYPETWTKSSVLVLDSLSRLVNGYFIFQMISAFRKYAKK